MSFIQNFSDLKAKLVNNRQQQYFHIHLISDATGETLETVARSATACYTAHEPIQHIYALVRTAKQLDIVFQKIETQPGIVLFTMVNPELRRSLEEHCNRLGIPSVSILDPVITTLANFLNVESEPIVGRQHNLDADYFRRIDALNYTLIHDDGQQPADLNAADIIIVGISRTSKTPTSFYLANRGVKVANIPLVPEIAMPEEMNNLTRPLVVGLVATTEQVMQIRRHRLETMRQTPDTTYTDRRAITAEITGMKKLCAKYTWPVIDVTRRSIEETAAAILNLYHQQTGKSET